MLSQVLVESKLVKAYSSLEDENSCFVHDENTYSHIFDDCDDLLDAKLGKDLECSVERLKCKELVLRHSLLELYSSLVTTRELASAAA